MTQQHSQCTGCGKEFILYPQDLDFYRRISPVFDNRRFELPPPSLCRLCREQQRLAFRNERALYRGTCALSGKELVSIYSLDKPFTVYEQELWWSDNYDPLAYGRDFDFSRTFFDQYQELLRVVPKVAIQNAKSVNCAYTNYSAENKNCYLMVGTLQSEDCLYGYRVFNSRNVVDCYDLVRSELCYQCLESLDLYDCQYCRGCQNSNGLRFCQDCIGCHDCLGSINLKNQEHCVLNKKLSPQEYKDAVVYWKNHPELFQKELLQLEINTPVRATTTRSCETCYGDQLTNCQNCFEAYSFTESRDCRYVGNGTKASDCQDCNFFDDCQLQYFCTNAGPNYNVLFSFLAWHVHDAIYCSNCFNSDHLFGCSGMKRHQYCIFNKTYSETEYEKLVARILGHMQETGEWGKFFPIQNSPFAYNETVAQELYPLTKDQALARGFQWSERGSQEYRAPSYTAAQTIAQVTDSVVQELLACEQCKRNYRITKAELHFYRTCEIALPRSCPDCRHKVRMQKRNLRSLFAHVCKHCGTAVPCAVSDAAHKYIVCETCYLNLS